VSHNFDLLTAKRRIFESNLKPLERLTGLALLDHWSRGSPEVFPSIRRLSRWTGLGRCAVMRALAGLERAGAIRPTRRDGIRSSYNLSLIMTLPVSLRD
jgi:hypothetical protein